MYCHLVTSVLVIQGFQGRGSERCSTPPPILEHVPIGTNFMGVGPGLVVTTVPESPEAVEIGPELADAALGEESLRTLLSSKLPVATPVQETGQVVMARAAPQSVPTTITEYVYVEGPASTEELLRCLGPKTSGYGAVRRSRWGPCCWTMCVTTLLLL